MIDLPLRHQVAKPAAGDWNLVADGHNQSPMPLVVVDQGPMIANSTWSTRMRQRRACGQPAISHSSSSRSGRFVAWRRRPRCDLFVSNLGHSPDREYLSLDLSRLAF